MGRKIFVALVTLAFLYVSSPLLLPIAMGGVLAVLFVPWLELLEKKNVPTSLGSALLTLGITVVLILPTSLLVFFAIKTGFQEMQSWDKSSADSGVDFLGNLMNWPSIHRVMVWVTDHTPVNMPELTNAFTELARGTGLKLTELLGGMVAHLPAMALGLAIVVVSIYFFLVDGRKLVMFFRRNSVFTPQQTEHLIEAVGEMCRSVILAAVASGGLQAICEALACVVTRTPNVALIGLLVFIGSFIPVVGSAPITFGVAIQQMLVGRQVEGVVLFIAAILISGLDNLIRPWFLRGATNLHPLVAFVAAFGGLQTLGFLGVFLGPIIAALFIVTVQILISTPVENSFPDRNS